MVNIFIWYIICMILILINVFNEFKSVQLYFIEQNKKYLRKIKLINIIKKSK